MYETARLLAEDPVVLDVDLVCGVALEYLSGNTAPVYASF
jgi:hypothetical protein